MITTVAARYLLKVVPTDKFTTIEVHHFVSSLLVLCWTHIDGVQRPCQIQVTLHSFVIGLYDIGYIWHSECLV